VDVLLTIDTEVHACTPVWRETALKAEIEQYIFGRTSNAEYGLNYQLSVLKRRGLKAVFFVEALIAAELGSTILQPIVCKILEAGHEVQLHVHPEWLAYQRQPIVERPRGQFLHQLTESEQQTVIERAAESLAECGAPPPCAFRAGNYGADVRTLRGVASSGMRFDSSWNAAYIGGACRLDVGRPLLAPERLEGVWEIPISFFYDYPGHVRHTQLAACSYAELKGALMKAARAKWPTFVIVSHSFELVWRQVRRGRPALPRRLVIRRFERLCRFLDRRRDQFRTVGFNDVCIARKDGPALRPLRSPIGRTAARMAEQVLGRFI